MKVAIIRFSALGDVAMTVPILECAARQYPNVQFLFISRPFVAPLFEKLPANVSFLGADLKGEHKGFIGMLRLAHSLHQKGVTHVADLHGVLRSKLLRTTLRLYGVPTAHIDKGRKDRYRLIHHKGKMLPLLRRQHLRYADVLEKIGLPIKLDFKSLTAPPKFEVPAIGIAPFAAHRGKIYPIDQTEQVVRRFIEHHPEGKIFVFGSQNEMKVLRESWNFEMLSFVCDVTGNLAEEIDLMGRLHVMMSMDSANMHLASLVGTPVVSIWGATHPAAGFMGYGQPDENAIQVKMACRPCSIYGQKPCRFRDYPCLKHIEVARITRRIDELIELQMHAQ